MWEPNPYFLPAKSKRKQIEILEHKKILQRLLVSATIKIMSISNKYFAE